MKKIISIIGLYLISCVIVYASQVTLAWDASPSGDEVASYNIHYGFNSGTYTMTTNAGNNLQLTIDNLLYGQTYYFAATAVGTNQLESDFSNEISYTVPMTNDYAPILSFIPDQEILDGTTNLIIPIFVEDQDDPPNPYTVTVTYGALVVSYSYNNNQIELYFNQGPVGNSSVTVTIDDGIFQTSQTFQVSVKPWVHIDRYDTTHVVVTWPRYKTAYLQYKTNLSSSFWINSPTFTDNPAYFNFIGIPTAFFRVVETNFAIPYLLTESFEGTGYENPNWIRDGSATINPDFNSFIDGSNSLNIIRVSQTGRVFYELNAPESEIWFYCLFKVDEPITSTIWIANFASFDTPTICQFKVLNTGNLCVEIGSSGGVTTTNTINTGIWYHVWGHYRAGVDSFASIAFSTDSTLPISGASYAEQNGINFNKSVTHIILGDSFGAAVSTSNCEWDKLLVANVEIGSNPQ